MGIITITLDRFLPREVYDGCKKNGQKIWWIKKGNKFVDIGRANHANRPLSISIENPEPGEYTVGCGPDVKDGGIREKITIPGTDHAPQPVRAEVQAAKPSVRAGPQAGASQSAPPKAEVAPATAAAADDALSRAEAEVAEAVKHIMSRPAKAVARQDLLAFLEKSVKTDIAYLQHLLCRIDEARVSDDSIPDVASCFVGRSAHSLASARQVLGQATP